MITDEIERICDAYAVSDAFRMRASRPMYADVISSGVLLYTQNPDDLILRPRVQSTGNHRLPWQASKRVNANDPTSLYTMMFVSWRSAVAWSLQPWDIGQNKFNGFLPLPR